MVVETKATPSNEAKLEIIDLRGISDGEDAFPQMKQSGKKPGVEGKSALGLERGRPGRKPKMGAEQSKVKTGGSTLKGGAKGGTPVLKKKDEGAEQSKVKTGGSILKGGAKGGTPVLKKKDEGASGAQKRGPGRPKKEDEVQKRGPGRPRKEEEIPKRGPGRPRKEDEGQKRPPGRPKREEASPKGGAEKPKPGAEKVKVGAERPKVGAEKRGPGRPRREDESASKGAKGKKPPSLQQAKQKSSTKGTSSEKPSLKRKAAAEVGSGGREAKRLKGEKGQAKGPWPGKAGGVQAKPGSPKGGLANKGAGFKGVKVSGKGPGRWPKKTALPGKPVQAPATKKGGVRAAFEAVRTLRNSKVLGIVGAKSEASKGEGGAQQKTGEEGVQQKTEPQLSSHEKADKELEIRTKKADSGSGEGDANEARSSEATESDREEAPGVAEDAKGPAHNSGGASEEKEEPRAELPAEATEMKEEPLAELPAEPPAERRSFVQAAFSGLFPRSKTAEVGALESAVETESRQEDQPVEEGASLTGGEKAGEEKEGLPEAVSAAGAEDVTAVTKEGENVDGGEESAKLEQPDETPGEGVAEDMKEAGPLGELAGIDAAPVAEAEEKAADQEKDADQEKVADQENLLAVTLENEPEGEKLVAAEKAQEDAPVAPPPSAEDAKPMTSLTPQKAPVAEEGAPANDVPVPGVVDAEEEGSKLVLRLEPEEGKADGKEETQEERGAEAVLDGKGEDSGLEKMGEEVEVGAEVTGPERGSEFGRGAETKPQDRGGDKEGDSGGMPDDGEEKTAGSEKMATRGLGKRERVPVTRFFEEEEAPQRAKAEKPSTKTRGGFKCDICGMVFGNGQALGGHKGSHKLTDALPVRQPPPSEPEPPFAPRGYECDLCGLVFPSGQKLGGHKSSHKAVEPHFEKLQGATVPEGGASGFTCDICGLVFGNGQALGGHKGSHKPTDAYTEEEKLANTKKGTRAPFQKEKKSPKSAPVKERPVEEFVPLGWPCEICGLVFPTGQALGGHKGSHKATYCTELEKPSPRPSSAAPRSARLLRRLEEKAGKGDANDDAGSSDENGSLRRARPAGDKRTDGAFVGRSKLPMSLRPKDRLQSLAAIVSKKSRRVVSTESLGEEERERNSKRIVERLKRTAGAGPGPASPRGQKGKGMDSFEEDAVAGLMVLRHAAENAPARPERHRRKRSRVKSSPTGAPSMSVPPGNEDASTLAAAKVLVGKTGVLEELEAEEVEEDERERTVSDDGAFSSGAEKSGREERRLLTSLGVVAEQVAEAEKGGIPSGGPKQGDPSRRERRRQSGGGGRRGQSSGGEKHGQSSGGDKSEEDKPRRPETRTKEERRVTRKLRDSSDEEEVWRPRTRERGVDGKREKKGGEKKQRHKPLVEVVAREEALPSKGKEGAPSKALEPAKPANPLAGWIKKLKEGTLFGPAKVASPTAGLAVRADKTKEVAGGEKDTHSGDESHSSDEPLAKGVFRVPPSKRASRGGVAVKPLVTAAGELSPPLLFSIPVMEEVHGGKGSAELSDEEMDVPLSALKTSKKKSVLGAGLLGDVPVKGPELSGKAEPARGMKFKALAAGVEGPKLAKLNLLMGLPLTGLVAPGQVGKGEVVKKGTDGGEKKERKKRKRREDADGEGKQRKKKDAAAEQSRSGSPSDEGKSGFRLGMKRPWQPAPLPPRESGGFRPFVTEVSARKVADALKGVRKGPKKPPKSGRLQKSLLGRAESDSGDEDAPIGLLSKMRSPEKKGPEKGTPEKKPAKGLVPEAPPRGPVEEVKKPRKRRRREEDLRTVKLGDGVLALPANGGSNASDPGSLTEANSGSESEDVPIGRRVGGYTEITQERPNHVDLEEEIQRAVQESVAMLQQINEEQEQEARRRKLKKEERAARKKRRKEAGEGLWEPEEELPVVGGEKGEGKPHRSKSKSKRNKEKALRATPPLTPTQELPLFADALPLPDVPPVRLSSPSQSRPRHVSSSVNDFLEKLGLGDFVEKAWSRKPSRAAPDAFGRSADGFGRASDDLGRAPSVRPSYTVLTEEEEFENAILQSKLNREELSAAYLALKSAIDTGRVPAREKTERFDLNTGLSLGGPSRGATPSPAPFLQALREGGLRHSSTPPPGRETPELGAFFRDKGVVKNGKWLPMHHPGEKDVLGGEPRTVDLARGSEGGLWGRSENRGQPDLPAVKSGLAQFLGGGMEGRGPQAGVARASSHDSAHERPLLDKTLDLNLAVPLSNRSSPVPSSIALPPIVAPTWTNITEKELLSRDWDLPTWLPPQLEGRRDSFSKKPYAPPRFSPRDQTGVSGPPLFNGPQPDVWKNKKDLEGLLNPDRPWPNLLGQRQEAAGGGDGEPWTAFMGNGGGIARRESPGFLELRVLSPSVQDQPLFSEKELMESRAQGLVLGGLLKDPPQTQYLLRRENSDLIKSAETLRRLLGKNESMTSPAIRSYAEGVNKMLMEGSKLLPDPEGQSNPEHHDSAISAKRSFEGAPAAFSLQPTVSGPDAEQRQVECLEREKPKSSSLPGWLVSEIEKRRKAD